MYCTNCGKQIKEDSAFCQFCGHKMTDNYYKPNSESSSKKDKVTPQPIKKSKKDLLWEKFVEVYDAQGDERKKFYELSSTHIWELLERLYTNSFETFIQDNKKELNSQPYKAIEALKDLYLYAVVGGYRLWIAEAILNEKPLGEFKSFNIDEFVQEWKLCDFPKEMKIVSDEMRVCVSIYLNYRIESFINNFPSIKEVSSAKMEELRNSITFQIINGYLAGKLEAKFRR